VVSTAAPSSVSIRKSAGTSRVQDLFHALRETLGFSLRQSASSSDSSATRPHPTQRPITHLLTRLAFRQAVGRSEFEAERDLEVGEPHA
jgi:hypothetical protein